MKKKKQHVVVCECPTCGHALPAGRLRVDLDNNVLLADGRAIKLQPREAELLWYLVQQYPRMARRDAIVVNVWGNAEVCFATVKSAISDARRPLRMIGWTLKCEHGIGYRLAPLSSPSADRRAVHPEPHRDRVDVRPALRERAGGQLLDSALEL